MAMGLPAVELRASQRQIPGNFFSMNAEGFHPRVCALTRADQGRPIPLRL
jgi:hypothetical protein